MTQTNARIFFLFCLINLCPLFMHARQLPGNISGHLTDSVTQKPLDFITIALKKDNSAIKTTLSDAQGNYSFSKVPAGKYTLTAVAMGYAAKSVAVELKEGQPALTVANILLAAVSNHLNEVSVTADRPVIKQETDRITYDIQADPENKVLSALDMMRKVPMLSLDADDNIKLKGSGKFKILINGKPSGLVARDPKEILRSMPASSIQKIEVITTPPAKYDSEGLAGIINIITSKKMDDGYSGSLSAGHRGPAGGPGLHGTFTLKKSKFGLNAMAGDGLYISPESPQADSRTSSGTGASTFSNSGFRKQKNNWRYMDVELSYEIDTLNLITAELNPYSGYNNVRSRGRVSQSGEELNYNYDYFNRTAYHWKGFDASFNYQLGFKSHKDRLLTLSYKFSDFKTPQENEQDILNRFNYTAPGYFQTNTSSTREQTVQLDYVHPLKKINIEAGLKGILRDNDSRFESGNFDEVTQSYLPDAAMSNSYTNTQDILSAYNSYAFDRNNWGFKAGVRLEGTFVKADFVSSGTAVDNDYFNVIPTVSVNRKFKNMSSLNFGYTQRIQRPGIDELNPFVDRSRANFEFTGNPDLKAVLSHNLDLTYSKFKKGSVSAGASYSFSNNTLQQVYTYSPEDQITHITYLNVGKERSLLSNLNISYPVTDKMNVSLSGNIGYSWLQGMIEGELRKNRGMKGYANLNAGYKFEHNWKANASFSYSAPDVLLQGKTVASTYLNLSASKDLIKDKLTLSGAVANPFKKYRNYSTTTKGSNFEQLTSTRYYFRAFNARLNWRFGKLKDGIKKNQRSISNEDVKSSSKGG